MNLRKKASCLLLFIFTVLIVTSCGERTQSAEEFVDSLPQVSPQKINSFQSAGDTLFFSHLGYSSIPAEEGFLLYDRNNPMLLQLNTEGELVKLVAREGRGPGEVGDIISLTKNSDGEILLYDQKNKKVVFFDKELNYATQFLPESFKGNNLIAVYPAAGDGRYLTRHSSFAFLRDETKDPKSFLTTYDVSAGAYRNSITLRDRMFARLIIDGRVRGGSEVAFSPNQLFAYNPTEESLYTYWTGSPEIAEISASFDTLRTIPVDLPSQEFSNEELDSLKEKSGGSDHWNTLSGLLPEKKTPVEKMKMGPGNQLWLKLNYSSDSEMWGIMDQDGEFQKIVHLPKGSMLTHISKNHLGVRLDDITFALYEPVQ